jgi:peptidoglycan hydrolase-like protein with peptidoglycan-binding domain
MADEPTLRRGDQSADGWVEYLQTQLKAKTDLHLPTLVEVTGKFDEVTHWAVVELQVFEGLQSTNGVVGNETWAALLGDPEYVPPGHDGTGGGNVDRGLHMRFQAEPFYENEEDRLTYTVFSVGTSEPAEGEVTLLLHLRDPQGDEYQLQQTNDAGQDRQYRFTFYDVTKHHPHGAFNGIAQLTHGSQVLDTGSFDFTARGEQFIDL